MKVLIVSSGNRETVSPFVAEQAHAISKQGVEVQFFQIKGKGFRGYLRNLSALKKTIKALKINLVHAHFGLSGMLAVLQKRAPVVVTFHGSDINNPSNFRISKLAMKFSAHTIFVDENLINKMAAKRGFSIIPCGIDLGKFYPFEKEEARKQMGFQKEKKYVLFSSAFENRVKNYPLAKAAMDLAPEAELLELKGYNREEVNWLMNSVDALLMTSYSEGSPQVVKEAMACNLPIVSVDVGDVKNIFGETAGCFIAKKKPVEISEKIKKAIECGKTRGRKNILKFDNISIAKQIIEIYQKLV